MKYLIAIFLLFSFSGIAAQDAHRRNNYFETFVEVKDSIDSIVIFKSKREMITYNNNKKIKKYIISLGMEPVGKKQFEGDMKTPEGKYSINTRTKNSNYHCNLGISYPSISDSVYAVSINKSAGGEIKIHGFPNKHKKHQERDLLNADWTLGCIAVSDFEIDELYKWVIFDCPIVIFP